MIRVLEAVVCAGYCFGFPLWLMFFAGKTGPAGQHTKEGERR